MWAGFVLAPVLTLTGALLFVYLKFGKDNFPFLLKNMDSEIVVIDDVLNAENAAGLSERVGDSPLSHHYSKSEANHAALFVEEKAYLVTTGYNRNMIRFSRLDQSPAASPPYSQRS